MGLPAENNASPDLAGILHRTFGHRAFRPHQQEVCEAAAAGRDVLLVMPTGAGKSLCYQLPALALGGTALVISPLIALMDDQAGKLTELGLRVARIHSGLSRDDARQACRDYLAGTLDFLFIAPERMRVPGFPEMLARRKPALIAIDEAHCISQWGHDFRPDYRTLGQYLPALRPASIVALTATATPTVRKDILAQLQITDAAVFVTGFRRDNLAVEAVELSKPQRNAFTLKLLNNEGARPAIVYAPSRKAAEELADVLNKKFPARAYHAGLQPSVRSRVQSEFLSGKVDVVVATIAFGMGIDKADVRTVVHTALPASVEGFYQEIGRAGRDGLPSRSVLLHGFADRKMHEFFLERDYPATDAMNVVARALRDEFETFGEIARRLHKVSHGDIGKALDKLASQGVAVFDIAGNVRRTDVDGWQTGYEQQVAFRREQTERMAAFAEATECRMAALIRHFGDTRDKARSCGRCDICAPKDARGSVSRTPDKADRQSMRALLQACSGNGQSVGKLFTDLALTRDRETFDGWIDGLSRAGLLHIANETFRTSDGRDITYRKASATHEGRNVDDAALDTVYLRDSSAEAPTSTSSRRKASRKTASKSSVLEKETVTLSATQQQVETSLRAWRKALAAEQGKPAFLILGDAVLRGIALAEPSNLVALEQVRGVGPQKVEAYGAAILQCVREPGSPSPSVVGQHIERPAPKQSAAAAPKPAEAARLTPPRAIPAPISIPRPTPPAPPEIWTAVMHEMEAQLKAWRAREATAANLPAFFILSDSALRNIVSAAPASLADLASVRGLGPEKAARFGPAILQVFAS